MKCFFFSKKIMAYWSAKLICRMLKNKVMKIKSNYIKSYCPLSLSNSDLLFIYWCYLLVYCLLVYSYLLVCFLLVYSYLLVYCLLFYSYLLVYFLLVYSYLLVSCLQVLIYLLVSCHLVYFSKYLSTGFQSSNHLVCLSSYLLVYLSWDGI